MKVEFSPNAEADLDEIAQYIARDNLHTAERWIDKLVQAARGAANAPLLSNQTLWPLRQMHE